MEGESDFCRFFKIQDLDIKMRGEIPSKTLVFRLNFFSNVSKKFFIRPTAMLEISRRCVLPS